MRAFLFSNLLFYKILVSCLNARKSLSLVWPITRWNTGMYPFCEQTFKHPNSLKKSGRGLASSPLDGLPTVKISDAEQTFLALGEYRCPTSARVDAIIPGQRVIAKTSLTTGVHSSEVENLAGVQITPYRITYKNTKNGKVRSVPILEELFGELQKNAEECLLYVEKHLSTFWKGGNILVLKDILGHSDIKMIMIYAHFAPTNLEDTNSKNR